MSETMRLVIEGVDGDLEEGSWMRSIFRTGAKVLVDDRRQELVAVKKKVRVAGDRG